MGGLLHLVQREGVYQVHIIPRGTITTFAIGLFILLYSQFCRYRRKRLITPRNARYAQLSV